MPHNRYDVRHGLSPWISAWSIGGNPTPADMRVDSLGADGPQFAVAAAGSSRWCCGEIGSKSMASPTARITPGWWARTINGRYVRSLTGDLTGSGNATLAGVHGDAELSISGSGSVKLGSVDGKIDARISGSGAIAVAGGTSRALYGSVSGSGQIDHCGTVRESARLRVSGSGSITATAVTGAVEAHHRQWPNHGQWRDPTSPPIGPSPNYIDAASNPGRAAQPADKCPESELNLDLSCRLIHHDQYEDEVCAACGQTSAEAGSPGHWAFHWRTRESGSCSAQSCGGSCAKTVEAMRDQHGVLKRIPRSADGRLKRATITQ
ncbi:DUF2807 domain-containing protein [Nocardia sp. NPDC050793]|uniref:GIN domain-containing protein n=1 Tax=Nocardia sp. NPDC050793 TaxID=3155159 RepID=UPI0033C7F1D1